jgi:hypothetical protein
MAPMFAIRPAVALLLCSLLLLPGCAIVTVAGAVAGAAISVGGAVVSTGVKVTGAVVEAAIDDDDEDDD